MKRYIMRGLILIYMPFVILLLLLQILWDTAIDLKFNTLYYREFFMFRFAAAWNSWGDKTNE